MAAVTLENQWRKQTSMEATIMRQVKPNGVSDYYGSG